MKSASRTIGIDARLFGPRHTGIGRYTQSLLDNLFPQDQFNHYIVFGDPTTLLPLARFKNVNIVKLKTPIYSLAEQAINPIIFSRHKLDLLHVPHLNAPYFYPGRTVVTIHDLIKHYSTGTTTTTLPWWQYRFKHASYKLLVDRLLKKTDHIITPSHFWKNHLIGQFDVNPNHITVTYEAPISSHQRVKKINPTILQKYELKKPYLIYTGNLYPHKNVPFLLEAVNSFNKSSTHKITLGIISGRSAFSNNIKSTPHIKMLGFVPDQDFPQLYAQALALVQPSLIEGFGLTGLEAMQLGLPVLSSSATCLPEIYGDAALYFDPHSKKDLVEKIDWILKESSLRTRLIKAGVKRAESFSWKQTAQQTLAVYKQVLQS